MESLRQEAADAIKNRVYLLGSDYMLDIESLCISDIQPSQFYLSQKKVAALLEWFDKDDLTHFEPVPICALNGEIIFTDGHTRAWVASQLGLTKIPLRWDESIDDPTFYEIRVVAAQDRGIKSIRDLTPYVVDEHTYETAWNDWCHVAEEVIAIQRKLATT